VSSAKAVNKFKPKAVRRIEMSDRDRLAENQEPGLEDDEVEAHRLAMSDEGDDSDDVEAHRLARSDEGDDSDDVEAHRLA
jgi:hypothetical protein